MNLRILKQRPGETRRARVIAVVFLLTAGALGLQAEVAITEVMTSASSSSNGQPVVRGPDFIELTLFGNHALDLTDYRWSDRSFTPDSTPFAGVVLQPGESVIFFRARLGSFESPDDFRRWWGLPDTVQVYTWGLTPGLNAVKEWVEVWDAVGQLVDSVYLGPAQTGVTFTYDPETGVFGKLSVEGEGGVRRAVTADDIGSPGTTTGPVAPYVVEQPVCLEVDACQDAQFSVRAGGVPRAKYAWRKEGVLLHDDTRIAGATSNTLTILNVEVTDAGRYWVEVHNAVGAATSLVATLTVNTSSRSPTIVQPPADALIYPGQSACFTVAARGYPCLIYQWSSNGVALAGATSRTFCVSGMGLAETGVVYAVEVRNVLGVTNAAARLRVTRKPLLRISEVMPWTYTNGIGKDYFEVTNDDTNAVSLLGWKFFDNPNALLGGLPVTITQAVTLQPAQSVVFVERMTPEAFMTWWGTTNLPPDLLIVPYAGFGLSRGGGTLYLWNPAATDPEDFVDRVLYWSALNGVSMYWVRGDPEPHDSEAGVLGAFRSADGEDVGSPGFALGVPPRFCRIACDPAGTTVSWQVSTNGRYCVQFRLNLGQSGWSSLGTVESSGGIMTFRHQHNGGWPQGFYRVREGVCP